jgi:hypothetical protein
LCASGPCPDESLRDQVTALLDCEAPAEQFLGSPAAHDCGAIVDPGTALVGPPRLLPDRQPDRRGWHGHRLQSHRHAAGADRGAQERSPAFDTRTSSPPIAASSRALTSFGGTPTAAGGRRAGCASEDGGPRGRPTERLSACPLPTPWKRCRRTRVKCAGYILLHHRRGRRRRHCSGTSASQMLLRRSNGRTTRWNRTRSSTRPTCDW